MLVILTQGMLSIRINCVCYFKISLLTIFLIVSVKINYLLHSQEKLNRKVGQSFFGFYI